MEQLKKWLTFEKRFKIRPRGVVSKNDIGERSTLANILLCNVLDALSAPIASEKDAPKTAISCTEPNNV